MLSNSQFNLLVFLFFAKNIGCGENKTEQYVDRLGDIPFESGLDNSDFLLCKPDSVVHSRLSLSYVGGWGELEKECLAKFEIQPIYANFSGYIMIHFLVNCNYEMDRFRVEVMDFDFNPKECPKAWSENLISIVQSLDKWQRTSRYVGAIDCSKYLNFKIVDGKIKNIIH